VKHHLRVRIKKDATFCQKMKAWDEMMMNMEGQILKPDSIKTLNLYSSFRWYMLPK